MGAWVTGHNLAGYLPEADTFAASADWSDAANVLRSTMREYADTNDDMALDCLPADAAEDDQPNMLAHVEAILTDDGPREGQPFDAIVADSDDRGILFWLVWSDDAEPDTES